MDLETTNIEDRINHAALCRGKQRNKKRVMRYGNSKNEKTRQN
jgi:hypothetical protein